MSTNAMVITSISSTANSKGMSQVLPVLGTTELLIVGRRWDIRTDPARRSIEAARLAGDWHAPDLAGPA